MASAERTDGLFRRAGELLLVAWVVGVLLWWIGGEHAALRVAANWADQHIDLGVADPSQRQALAMAFRESYGWQDSTGEWRAYPVSRDSFYFLRLARNIVEQGNTCGLQSADECLDRQVLPPDGRAMLGAHSPHVWGIALLYQGLQLVGVEAPSWLWVGVLHNRVMLLLCALLTYLLCRQVMPALSRWGAGLAAVSLVFMPAVMQRSFGVDNDVWVLALLLGGALCSAYWLRDPLGGLGSWLAVLGTGLSIGLLAAAWGGWLFLVLMVSSASVVVAGYYSYRRERVGSRLLTLLSRICLVIAIALLLIWRLAPELLKAKVARTSEVISPISDGPPPDAFATVAELAPTSVDTLLAAFGGVLLLAALVGLSGLLYRLWIHRRDELPAPILLLLAWSCGAGLLAITAERYLLLLGPPIAIFAGLGVATLGSCFKHSSRGAAVIAVALIMFTVFQALERVRDNRPQLNSAWVNVLSELAETTPKEALLINWWDSGHWASYWSRRSVVLDGASLRDPRVHEVGRLLAADPDQPLAPAIYRAACGSETQCGRPLYLLTSNELLRDQGWMFSGFWQSARADLVDRLAAGETVEGFSEQAIAEAAVVDSALARSEFAAPAARIWSKAWSECRVSAEQSYHCPLSLRSANGWVIERFVVPEGRLVEAYLEVRHPQHSDEVALKPPLLRLATPLGLLDLQHRNAPANNPGVLLDTVEKRVFVGSPELLRSLLVRLELLDGRYDRERFMRSARASTVDGIRVTAWQIAP